MENRTSYFTHGENFSHKIQEYIGSPLGLGKASKIPPDLNIPIKRQVLTRKGELQEREIILTNRLGSGLGSVVYKGICNGKQIVEKFTGDIFIEDAGKRVGKKSMEYLFALFRQTLPSYRTNFYAAMTNHYMSLVIEHASEFEFGESIIPCIQYTSYDKKSGGYTIAYEFLRGRPIRTGVEVGILRDNLNTWKDFIGEKLGFWGIARQCDVNNINSPANVFIVEENTKKMKLLDITPAVLGGQIYFLPLEFEYFLKGILTGNFLPFGDAVDLKRFNKYRIRVLDKQSGFKERFSEDRIIEFRNNCQMFEFYLKKWRNSEPALLRSPVRIFAFLFNMDTIKSTTKTTITNFDYKGVIDKNESSLLKERLDLANGRIALAILRIQIFMRFTSYIISNAPGFIDRVMRFLFIDMPVKFVRFLVRSLKFLVKIYTDVEYRKKTSKEKIEAEIRDGRITQQERCILLKELDNIDILGILQLGPLWIVTKIIKPPFVGTAINITVLYSFIATHNPYWLIILFADGMIRFVIAVLFTGFKYKPLLLLSLIPTLGFVIPIPTQIMKDAPHLARFFMQQVVGVKLGTSLPGIDIHSFRTYFYIRLMNIPLFFMKAIVWSWNRLQFRITKRYFKGDKEATEGISRL
jgi:hypothetical protein